MSEEIKQKIISGLRQVYDPEISTNIYDLGLVYKIDLESLPLVTIDMTLTSAWCPSADDIVADVNRQVLSVESVTDCKVNIVWTPQWGPHMMSEEAQLELNMMQDFTYDMDPPWGPHYR